MRPARPSPAQRNPDVTFAAARDRGSAGRRRCPVVNAASLTVVGLVEVVLISRESGASIGKLLGAARRQAPDAAILTDSPDFHLRLARVSESSAFRWSISSRRKPGRGERAACRGCARYRPPALHFPVRTGILPRHGIDTVYTGHPLTRLVRPSAGRRGVARKVRNRPTASV